MSTSVIPLNPFLKFMDFLVQFKAIERVIYCRRPNGAMESDSEHSFELAMAAWYCISAFGLPLSIDRTIRYALVHDLVEVYAGDTYAFDMSVSAAEKSSREHIAVRRIASEFGEFPELINLLEMYEDQTDDEARFVYALDKVLPSVNALFEGGTHAKKDVQGNPLARSRVYRRNAPKVAVSPVVAKLWDDLFIYFEQEAPNLFGINDVWQETSEAPASFSLKGNAAIPLDAFLAFINFLIQFKAIERVVHCRRENGALESDAEHSFELAMMAWYCISAFGLPLSADKALCYALSHDLVETYAGDTYSYDTEARKTKIEREHASLMRIQQEFPEFGELIAWIEAYENRADDEAKFVYALDKILPVANAVFEGGTQYRPCAANGGRAITASQVWAFNSERVLVSPIAVTLWEDLFSYIQKDMPHIFAVDLA